MSVSGGTIEVVRGEVDDERAARIQRFSQEVSSPDGDLTDELLRQVVCILLDDTGEIVGVNYIEAETAEPVDRLFWRYRSLFARGHEDASSAMFNAAFAALDSQFDPLGSGPIGLSVTVSAPAEMERRPEVIWPDEELLFAGYRDDRSQLRIRYFWNAKIGPGVPNPPMLEDYRDAEFPIEDRYRIEPFRDSAITPDDVLDLWAREGAVGEEEAQRRVHEVQVVATEADEGVVGVSTAYVRRNPQLRMDLWYYRTFVSQDQRHNNLAAQLVFKALDFLEERFVRGEDRRAAGIAFELENREVMRFLNGAVWIPSDFIFIGETKAGAHVRVHYFPGARVPLPRQPFR